MEFKEIEVKKKDIVKLFTGKNSLVSTRIKKISIFDNKGILNVEIVFSNFSNHSDFKEVKFIFSEIIEYNFSFNNDYIFYNVETFKFLEFESIIYLSLDPDDQTEVISSHDLDFVKSNKVELIVMGNGTPATASL